MNHIPKKLAGLITFVLVGTSCAADDEQLSEENSWISAPEILQRADFWYQHRWDGDMTYDQGRYHADPQGKLYRRDCSGFVSMAWHLDHSRVTYQPDSLANVAKRITKNELQPGDLVMAPKVGDSGHAVLFERWIDSSHSAYMAYEFGGTPVKHHKITTNGDDLYVGDGRVFYAYAYPKNGGDHVPPDDPPPPNGVGCGVDDDGKLYCTNSAAEMHASPTLASAVVNHLRTTSSWFDCWGTGDLHAGGNTTWYHTLGDDNASYGWVPGVNLNTPDAFDADPSAHGLKKCGSSNPPPPSPSGDCSVHADHRLYCTNSNAAPLYSEPTFSTAIVNRLRTTSSWFECWGSGDQHAGGNTTWYYTQGDDNATWGWVPAVNLDTTASFDGNPGAAGLPLCEVPIPSPSTSTCSVHSDQKLYCDNTSGAAVRSTPNNSATVVNYLRTTHSWFTCWGTGSLHSGGNTTWYYTVGDDNGSWGWVPAVNLMTTSAFDDNPAASGLPHC